MANYLIAGVVFRATWHQQEQKNIVYLAHDCVVLPRSFRAFQMYEEQPKHVDIEVEVKGIETFEMPKHFKRIGNQICFQDGEDMVIGFLTDFEHELPGCSIRMNKDYSYVSLTPHRPECQVFDMQRIQYVFEGKMLLQGGFVMHGAAIEWNGRGIIFTGVSGSGKSTQAHLWKQFERAIIINGDCPAIRKTKNGVMMYGTPWCGSSGEYMDRETPLRVIVQVVKSEENKVRELTGNEKFMTILSQVFRSNVDETMLDRAIENITNCMGSVRVLELRCTKEKGAVEALKEYINSMI
ncbi:MAG: hypothetical protein K5895_12805 [Lachnospiraceae bacterium]|nr:hypothetical protein [Lachnospiraceae bacterium]